MEHKFENTATACMYIKKAHYIFIDLENQKLHYKIRGLSTYELQESNPVYGLIGPIMLQNETRPIESLFHIAKSIARVSDYLQSKEKDQIVFPGFSKEEEKKYKQDNLDLPYIDSKDFKERKKSPLEYSDPFLNCKCAKDLCKIYDKRIFDHENSMTRKSKKKTKKRD